MSQKRGNRLSTIQIQKLLSSTRTLALGALLLFGASCRETLNRVAGGTSTALLISSDPPTLTLANLAPVFNEADGTVSAATIAMDHRYTGSITIPYTVLSTTTTTTYTDMNLPTSGTLTIQPGADAGQLMMMIFQDSQYEADETIEIELGTPSVGFWFGPNNLIVTLQDDDPKPTVRFAVSTMSVDESHRGTATYPVVVQLNARAQSAVTATISVQPCEPYGGCQNATLGTDFSVPALSNGRVSVTIPAGATTAQFNFNVPYNPENENTESFNFRLESTSSNAQLPPVVNGGNLRERSVNVSINDNQDRILVSFASATSQEIEGFNDCVGCDRGNDRRITVNLSRAPTAEEGQVTVNLAQCPELECGRDWATPNNEYRFTPSNLIVRINPNQTSGSVSVYLPGDNVYERTSGSNLEKFSLKIHNVSNNAVIAPGGIRTHQFYILDNEPYPTIRILSGDHDKNERTGSEATRYDFIVQMFNSIDGGWMTADQVYSFVFNEISGRPEPANYQPSGTMPQGRLDDSDYFSNRASSTQYYFNVGYSQVTHTTWIRPDNTTEVHESTVVYLSPAPSGSSVPSAAIDPVNGERALVVRNDD